MTEASPSRSSSLRLRLTATAVLVLAIGLLAGALLITGVLRQALRGGVDDAARQQARGIAELVVEGRLPDPLPQKDPSGTVQVLDGALRVLSASAGGDRLVPLVGPADLLRLRRGGAEDLSGARLAGSGTLRVVGVVADTVDGQRTVVVALPAGQAASSLRTVVVILALALPLLVAGVGLLVWRLVGSALRPVESLRASAARITTSGAADRLPVPRASELAVLASTLNAMLDRLAGAEMRTRAFVADAAHELRTPLTTLRLQLEIAATHPGDLSDGALAAELVPDVERLTRLVEDLLMLARADAGALSAVRRPVDLAAVARQVASGPGWRVPVVVQASPGPASPPLNADPDAMTRVVRNLVDNAVRHAVSKVVVQVASGAESVRLRVTDDGAGIGAADLERVRQRFVRLDAARARDAGGTGLGLAIVAELARAHAGSLDLTSDGHGVQATVTLPTGRDEPRLTSLDRQPEDGT